MLFPTHLVAAALVGTRTRLPTAWLVVGAALPDVVDKPLAMVGLVDLFHTVGHSGLVFAVATVGVRYGPAATAVVVGWGSYLLLDAIHVVFNGRPADALFLGWPLVVPPDPLALGIVAFTRQYLLTPAFFLEGVLWGALVVVLVQRRRRRVDSTA